MKRWYKIENDSFTVQLTTLGAEMKRLFSRGQNKELLWEGHDSVWGRSAPHLFPIVGKLQDNEYELHSKNYQMSQHGFARDMNFTCTHQTDAEITFSLNASQESFKNYPYCFILTVNYKLVNQKIIITYEVINDDRQDIYFSLGAHPGFVLDDYKDYEIRFSDEETGFYRLDNGEVDWSKEYELNKKIINPTLELLKDDALIFKNLKSNYVDLVHFKKHDSIRLHFDSPYFGIWTKIDKGNIPFICLEPWSGVADGKKQTKDFTKKLGINKLLMGESFHFSYAIELLDR